MTITVELAIALATLLVENEHLVAFYQRRYYFAYYLCSSHSRQTYRHFAVVVNQQHLFKFNSLATFCILDVVDKKLLTSFCLELLTVNLYDCVHYFLIL